MLSKPVVVLDFETTGLSHGYSDRITEIAALRLQGNVVVDRFVTLVNAGAWIPENITALTGISNEMIADAPPASRMIRELVEFIGTDMIVAHNAGFDHGFLKAECARAQIDDRVFRTLCTVRLARRLLPGLPSYGLASVARTLEIQFEGTAHRAEADARVASHVLLRLAEAVMSRYTVASVDPELLRQVTGWPVRLAPSILARSLGPQSAPTRWHRNS